MGLILLREGMVLSDRWGKEVKNRSVDYRDGNRSYRSGENGTSVPDLIFAHLA